MRWFIGTLIALNLGILLWGWMGAEEKPSTDLASPGVGSIRLLGEAPAAPEPVAVPIPAPPRNSSRQDTPAESAASTAAAAAPTQDVRPLTAEQPAAPAMKSVPAPVVTDAPASSAATSAAAAVQADEDANIRAPEPRFVPEPESIPATAQLQCSRIGPFDSAAEAKATRNYLASKGKVSDHKAAGQVRVGYWVLIPPAPSRSAAEATAAQLKAKGITDLWIVSKGEVKNGISLGVFSQKENADSFVKHAKAKGFRVEIRDKTKPGQQLWLDYTGSKAISTTEIKPSAPAGVTAVSQGCR